MNTNKINSFTKSREFSILIYELIPGDSDTYTKRDDQFPLGPTQ